MNGIQDILIALGGFINAILIPVLFGLAFLFFLINTFRYFILEGDNTQSHEKAKRSALYGLAAFVFLLVLWGLIGIVVSGLNLTRDQALCSDYISIFRGNCGGTGTPFSSESAFPVGTPPPGGTGGGSGGGYTNPGNSNGGNSGNTSDPQISALAELVFGTGKDAAQFMTNQAAPQATLTTPNISSSESCVVGLEVLQQASRMETNQASYLLTMNAGSSAWTNVTDAHSAISIVYDADTIASSQGSGTSYLVHTHPRGRVDGLGATATGHGPTTADIQALCNNGASPSTHIVVDWNGVWKITTDSSTCPLSTTTQAALPIAETLIALEGFESSTRIQELEEYLADSLPPNRAKNYFSELLATNPTLLTNSPVGGISDEANTLLTENNITVSYHSNMEMESLCNGL